MDLSDLEALVAVVDAGGFARAATRLGVSKSLVSRRIVRLEADIGTTLLTRSPRGLAATDAGRELVERSRRILRDIAEARDAVAARTGVIAGRIRLAVPLSFGLRHLQPLFHRLHGAHPQLTLDLCYSDSQADLINGQFDAAVRVGRLSDSRLVARSIVAVRLVAVASPGYLARHAAIVDPQDLPGHECLVYTGSNQRQTWRFSLGEREQTVLPEGRFLADNGESLLHAAEAGLGVAALPDFIVAEGLRAGRLQRVLPRFSMQRGEIHLVTPPGGRASARIDALHQLLVESFGRGQAGIALSCPDVDGDA